MTASLPRLARLGGAAAVVLALTSCGTDLHPGAAAIVDDTTISQGEVDDLVAAACSYSEQLRIENAAGSAPTQSVAVLRSSITQQLIQAELSAAAADELGLTVNDSTVTALAAGNTMPQNIDAADEELLTTFFEDQARSILEQAVIGAHLRDPSITVADDSLTNDDVQNAQRYLREYAAEQDIQVNPAFGEWKDGSVVTASGSLSDPVSKTAKSAFANLSAGAAALEDLPASQVCG